MNNTFNTARFGQTFKADLMSNYRTYLMWIGAALGVIAVLIGFISWEEYNDPLYDWDIHYQQDNMWGPEFGIFCFGFMLIGAACASILMLQMANKRDAIAWLTLPSSQLEKFASRSLVCLIILPAVTFVGLGIIDLLRCMIASVIFPERYISPVINFFIEDYQLIVICIGYGVAIQSLFALGSTVWPKLSAIKSALALTAIAIVYTLILVNTVDCVHNPDYHYKIFSESTDELIYNYLEWIVFVPCCIFAAINYVVAYYRFKESEIIQRW